MKFKADEREKWKAAVLAAAAADGIGAYDKFEIVEVFGGGVPGGKITLEQILDRDGYVLSRDLTVTDYGHHTGCSGGPATPWGDFEPGYGGWVSGWSIAAGAAFQASIETMRRDHAPFSVIHQFTY
jgi:hypothetical protein